MRKLFTGILILLIVGAFMVGCERKVINNYEAPVGPTVAEETNCFTCHGGTAYLAEAKSEWPNSVHASGVSIDYTNRSTCGQCHFNEGFVDYLETGTQNAPYAQVSPIGCFTCHSPHETGDMSLRTTDPVELVDGSFYDHNESNLCVSCHKARTSPSTIVDGLKLSARLGPHHGPQGDIINGTIGYEYDDYDYTYTNHGNAIQKVCITCHMATPPETHNGNTVGGHSFTIEDEEGYNIGKICNDCHTADDEIDWIAPSNPVDFDHDGVAEGYMTEIDGLIDSLGVLLIAQGTVTGNLTDGFSPVADFVVDSAGVAGATWNLLTIVNEDKSHGMHNFRYIQGLLQSSIEYVLTQPVPGAVVAQNNTIASHK